MSFVTKLFSFSSDKKGNSPYIRALTSSTSQSIFQERLSEKLPYDKFELLFKIDPIIFRCVSEYINGIASSYTLIGGEESEKKELEKWMEENGILFKLQEAIQDILIYGNYFAELDINTKQKTMRILPLSPKSMDYIRDKNGYVLLDENKTPVGFVQKEGANSVEWRKNSIIVNGEEVLRSRTEDFRERIVHFKLWSWADSFLGITPLISAYTSALTRLNLSDAIGESSFRGGGILAQIKGVIPEKDREQLEEQLKNSTSRNVFVVNDKVELKNAPAPDLSGRERLIYYYADEVASGMGVPLSLIMSGVSGYSGERELKVTKWEESIKPLQLRFAYQVREQLFKRFWKLNGFTGEIPTIKFAENTPYLRLNKSRTIATYARRGLIRRDPELEMSLRTQLDLPVSEFLSKEFEEWKKNNRFTEDASKEIDNIERSE